MRTFRGPTIACLALAVCLGVRSPTARAVRLLPDLIAIEGSQFNAMQDGAFTTQLNSPKSQYRRDERPSR